MFSLRSKALRASRRFNSTSPIIEHYTTPQIPHIDRLRSSGIPGLLSAEGLDNAYYRRAEVYCYGLNKEISKSGLAAHDLDVIIKEYSKSPSKINLYNSASLLNNIEFAISSLGGVRDEVSLPPKATSQSLLENPDISTEVINSPPEGDFQDWIKHSFGSVLEFKTLLLNSANAINGDGFTWLVARKPKRSLYLDDSQQKNEYDGLFVLNTYNAGNPNNSLRFGQITEITKKLQDLKNKTHSGSRVSTSSILPLLEAKEVAMFDDIEYKPILAIDASPKAWLHDYGVYGKKQYLEQTWKALDWDIILRRVPTRAENQAYAMNVVNL